MKQFLVSIVFAIFAYNSSLSAETWKYFENDNWTVSVHEGQENLFCSAITLGQGHTYELGNVFLNLMLNAHGLASAMLVEEGVIWRNKEYTVGFHIDDDQLGTKLQGFGANGSSIMIQIPNNEIGRTLVNRLSNGNKLKIYDPDNFETLYSFDLSGSKEAIIELSRCAEKIVIQPT